MKLKNILKGFFGVFTGVLFMILTCQVAFADVIWTPDDDFYDQHSTKCDYIHRRYTANGSNGSVILWKSPESHKKVTTFENGTTFSVSYTYTDADDETWGIAEIFKDENPNHKLYSGWFRMKDLLVIYDAISFGEDHQSEFKDYNGEFDTDTSDYPIILWTYPGSGNINWKTDKLDLSSSFIYTYTDAEGRQWGYYTFTGGNKWVLKQWDNGSWICLSDPTNEKIPVIKYAQPTIIPPSNQEVISDTSDSNMFLVMVIAVVILVLFTAVLIRVFWKKNEKIQKQ